MSHSRQVHLHRAVTVALVVLSLTAGCGGAPTSASRPAVSRPATHRTITASPDPMPRGIRLSFVQQRLEEGTGRADIEVSNGTGRILHVRRVGLDWPGFPGPLTATRYPVPGGLVVDLRYLLPRADCASANASVPAYAVVVTATRSIRRPLPAEGRRFLRRIWETTCHEREIRQSVAIGLGDSWSAEGHGLGATLHGRLVLTRRSRQAPVRVDQVQGSVLFDLAMPGGDTLPRGAVSASFPLDVSPGRCDQHGRSQSQQTFVWRVWVRLDGGAPLAQVLVPTKGQQTRLLRFLDDACDSATGG